MKKQKLSLNLSLALIMVASLMSAMPTKVNAGEGVVNGSSVDSSSFGGGNFNRGNSSSVQINVSAAGQVNLNAVAIRVINQVAIDEAVGTSGGENISSSDDKTNSTNDGNFDDIIRIDSAELSPTAAVVAILTARTDSRRVQNFLEKAGVNSRLIQRLTKSMQRMIRIQNNQTNVDINKFSATINAYNAIIKQSDIETLKKLAADPEFMATRSILNQFRTALK
ncbi:hypothetical protein Riv7116_4479 [Rivularia sp. PCC 7116]|uniref:hypothetical protein n=1 Tax=Rivularia sp. PCC 7116 TaxID=373994 RepID=UPI00029F0C64|nr:hypothetical protein [Rivularia sp. PCC 7116]AFY56900.1 hypothetical protein Riv7116_4479 [Rivularia sp. PCC 7116]